MNKKTKHKTPLRWQQAKINVLHVEDIPEKLRRDFHAACVRVGSPIRQVIRDFMEGFVAKHQEK